MRGLALAVAVVAAVTTSAPARAQAPTLVRERGATSVAGASFLGLALGAAGLGLAGLLGSLDASALLQGYLKNGAPTAADAAVAAALDGRVAEQRTLAVVGFTAAGALLVAGVACLAVDAPRAPALAALPLPGGGWVAAAWRW